MIIGYKYKELGIRNVVENTSNNSSLIMKSQAPLFICEKDFRKSLSSYIPNP
jgi:hypothetical protein